MNPPSHQFGRKDPDMKTYIVYVNGIEKTMIKAASQNAAEKKAKAKFPKEAAEHPLGVTVSYTEV